MNIGFIGAGKVGCTLGKYLSQSPDVKITGYYSRSAVSSREAAQFTDSNSYLEMKELIEDSDTIFITVPDGSIRDVWSKIREYDVKDKIICHCSGVMSSADAFSCIEETGAIGYAAHPLFAVSDKFNAYRELSGVFFTLEGGTYAKAQGSEETGCNEIRVLLESLGNPTRVIRSEEKTIYHCAAAMASNLVCGLIDQSIELMKRCGFRDEEAVKALEPILLGNMKHIAEKGPTAALTGPVERNDTKTIEKHLECLVNDDEKRLYSLLTGRLVDMAQSRHPDRDYAEMSELVRKGE